MPGMNGRELAQRISAVRPETGCSTCRATPRMSIGHNGTLDAASTCLQKPFTLPALKAKVREVLDTPIPEVAMSARADQAQPSAPGRKFSPFRAQRFNLHLPLKYRQLGEQDWREGTTENISRSGMLFEAEEVICSPTCKLEINLVLPPEIAGLSPSRSGMPRRGGARGGLARARP